MTFQFLPTLLGVMLTLFFLMICGYLCRKKGWIDTTASKKLSSLILSVGQPMMIIGALNRAEYSTEQLLLAGKVTLIGFAVHTFLALFAYVLCKRFRESDQMKLFEFSLVFANCGFLGFPILDAIFGEGFGSFVGAFYVISFHLFLWTWGILILARGRSDIRLTPRKVVLNYGTVPCAIGVVLYLLKPLFSILEEHSGAVSVLLDAMDAFFSYLGGLCTPISVLITGALLATVPMAKMFKNRRLYLHSALKLLLLPMVVCVLGKLCGLDRTFLLLITAMTGVPSAATITMLAELYEIDPAYASQTVGMTSVLSTVTLPAVMLFAQWISTL